MKFNPGFSISILRNPMDFCYGEGVYGPPVERRTLDSIRGSLLDPACNGPKEVYCIAMDVGLEEDRQDLISRNLLYGVVTYASGKLGQEPVRSQGHIHAVSPSCNASTCEVYEIWEGHAIVYMQPKGGDNPGRCFAVHADPGEVVIVPPGWVHATVNADPQQAMTFGAWCVRDYGFDYTDVRRHGGIAFFPVFEGEKLIWKPNSRYAGGTLEEVKPHVYTEFGMEAGVPIYAQYRHHPTRFAFVTNPQAFQRLWNSFLP